MNVKFWQYGLVLIAGLLIGDGSSAFANDDILSQLRREDGTTGTKSRQPTPLVRTGQTYPQNVQIHPPKWNKPNWMVSRKNMPTISATNPPNADTIGFGTKRPANDLSFKAVLGWDSEFIFRGRQEAKQNVVGNVEASIGSAYAGAWAFIPSPDDLNAYQSRIDLYAGYGFDLGGSLYGDIGVNGYIRAGTGTLFAQQDSIEVYSGISWDGLLRPSLYAFYDIELERYTFEASAEYSLPFGRTDLVLGGTLGYTGGTGIEYTYFQADAELVYNFTRNTNIGIGAHFAAATKHTFLEGQAVTGDTTSWFGIRLRSGT